MFYERLEELCSKKSITVSSLVKELGLSTSKVTAWKNGTVPKGAILVKIADYFGVPLDYLMGRTDDPNQKPGESNIKLDEFSYAMYNESKELSDSDKQRLLTFARMLRESSEEANDN